MQLKDYITISISLVALLISFSSLLFTFLNYRRNITKLKITQLDFPPNPFSAKVRPNILYLDGRQSTNLWTTVPMLHLILYIKIDNLSYTATTIMDLRQYLGHKKVKFLNVF